MENLYVVKLLLLLLLGYSIPKYSDDIVVDLLLTAIAVFAIVIGVDYMWKFVGID